MRRCRVLLVLLLIALPFATIGCSKSRADAALKTADEGIAKVKPAAEKFAPVEFKSLANGADQAKSEFAAGNYSAALAIAADLPAKASEVEKIADATKHSLTEKWGKAQAELPTSIKSLSDRLEAFGARMGPGQQYQVSEITIGGHTSRSRTLVSGPSDAAIETLKSGLSLLRAAQAAWTDATAAFGAGDIVGAMAKADEVKTKIEKGKEAADSFERQCPKQNCVST